MPPSSSISTRLLAVLVVPFIVLGLLAVLATGDPTGRADNLAETDATLATVGTAAVLGRALAVEQLWAMAGSARTGTDPGDELVEAVRSTQDAVAALDGALTTTDTLPGIAERVEELRSALAGLQTLRPAVQSAVATQTEVLDAYSAVLDALAGLEAAAASTQPGARSGRSLAAWLALTRLGHATARADAALVALGEETSTALRAELAERARRARTEASVEEARFLDLATVAEARSWRDEMDADEPAAAATLGDRVLDGGRVEAATLARSAADRVRAGAAVIDPLLADARSATVAERDNLRSASRLRTVLAVVGALLSVLVGVVLIRLVLRPVRRLAEATEQVAHEQLPSALAQFRAGAAPTDTTGVAPLAADASGAEARRLAASFDTVVDLSLRTAAEQAAHLRKGISDLFVDLARRNQALLDRQIELIDQLESAERDPDQLESLFRLDHLATRMRRNAESLLVLAGAEPPRRRGRPVPLTEVLRVAVGEVADYGRIQLRDAGGVEINAEAAVDTAHLLAELMDNATQFSPPESTVVVSVTAGADGSQLVTIADRGIGMARVQLDEVNALLADPPVTGLGLGRSLGFVVIARLAARHRIAVRLDGEPSGGVVATVHLPGALLGAGPAPAALQADPPAVPATPATPAVGTDRPPVGVFVPTPHGPPSTGPATAAAATGPPSPAPFVPPGTPAPHPAVPQLGSLQPAAVQSPTPPVVPTGTVPTGTVPVGTVPMGILSPSGGPAASPAHAPSTGTSPAALSAPGGAERQTGGPGLSQATVARPGTPSSGPPVLSPSTGLPGAGPGADLRQVPAARTSTPAPSVPPQPTPSFTPPGPGARPAPVAQPAPVTQPGPTSEPGRSAPAAPATPVPVAPAAEHVELAPSSPPSPPTRPAGPPDIAILTTPTAPVTRPEHRATTPAPRPTPARDSSVISLFSAQARQADAAAQAPAPGRGPAAPAGPGHPPAPAPSTATAPATVAPPSGPHGPAVAAPTGSTRPTTSPDATSSAGTTAAGAAASGTPTAPAAPTAPAPAAALPVRQPGAGLTAQPGTARSIPTTDEDDAAHRRSLREQLRASVRGQLKPDEARPAPTQRSPEEVREMLARYRSGLSRGRSEPGAEQADPPTGASS